MGKKKKVFNPSRHGNRTAQYQVNKIVNSRHNWLNLLQDVADT